MKIPRFIISLFVTLIWWPSKSLSGHFVWNLYEESCLLLWYFRPLLNAISWKLKHISIDLLEIKIYMKWNRFFGDNAKWEIITVAYGFVFLVLLIIHECNSWIFFMVGHDYLLLWNHFGGVFWPWRSRILVFICHSSIIVITSPTTTMTPTTIAYHAYLIFLVKWIQRYYSNWAYSHSRLGKSLVAIPHK